MRHRISLLAAGLLVTAGFSGALAQAAAPASRPAPATAPAGARAAEKAAPADFSTPQKAVQSFLKADSAADYRAALWLTPENAPLAQPFLDVLVASSGLQKAARDQFGAAADQYFAKGTDADLQARAAQVDKADVKLEGDTATISLPADEASRQSAGTIVVKKVGDVWKIDPISLFGVKPGDKDNDKRITLAKSLTGVTNEMILEINGKKFSSPGDAYQEFWTRSLKAAKDVEAGPATTQAATQTKP